ncbi:MAG TPA: cysteine hydrolase family protein [Symbiobacteriaceae bacterium]|nr:cysteine hydrolase family protein [Symbiobacteriaceae bacterium]
MTGTALVIIDVQQGIIDLPAFDAGGVLARLARVLAWARAGGIPVIHVQHEETEEGGLVRGTPAWEIHPAVAPQPGEPVVAKTECDSFHETTLAAELAARGAKHLIIGGCQTDWCVQTTVRRALALGFRVTLLKDAHSTVDSRTETAAQIIDRTNRELAAEGAELRQAEEVAH